MSKVFNISFLHAKTKNQIIDGLMYRKKKLKNNQGMLFHTGLKVSSFWMKNTFIPLDVLFLNKNGKILGYKKNNKPHSLKGISIGKKSFYVLEMNGGWVRENKVKVGDKIKIRKSRTRKKRGGARHPLTDLASNDMLEYFRNPETNDFLDEAMQICRGSVVKRCLSRELIDAGVPRIPYDNLTDEDKNKYHRVIELCKPTTIVVPWNTQSGEGQGGGRKKKTRKKRGGTANLCKLFLERNNGTVPVDADHTEIDKYCKDHGDTNITPNAGNLCEVTTGNCWLPGNVHPRRLLRVNRPGNNQGNRRASVATTSLAAPRLVRQGGKRRRRTRKKTAGVKIDIGSFWTRINPTNNDKDVWQVIGIISHEGKGIIQIAKPENGNTMMRSYEKENFFRLYKPFNEKPGGDAVPQKVPKESGGDKIGGRRHKKTRKMRGQGKKRKKEDSSGSSGSKPAKKKTSTPQVDEATKCGICLKATRCTRCDNAVIHCPACNGIFHRYCLSVWINTVLPEVATCPLCRVVLPEETYTILGVPHPNQANNNNNVTITALDVDELYPIVNPTMITGNQGESEIQNVLRALISNVGEVTRFEIMSAVRFAITRAEQVAQHLGGNYNTTTNRTPFLQALIADWAALGGHGYYRYLNAYTGIASIGMEPQIQPNELQLHTQNRERIENVATIQDLYAIINETIANYEAGPGTTNAQVTPFYQALIDDRVFLEVFL